MVQSAGIVVAHDRSEERERIGAALHEAGYEVIPAINGKDALRTTVGLNPRLVIAQAGMQHVSGYELPERLQATGLTLPPILILYGSSDELPETMPSGEVYCVFFDDLNLDDLVQYVRLVMLAGQVEGEFGGTLDQLHGDLTRSSFGDLLSALQRHVISGSLTFNRAAEAVLWFEDGAVVDACWGDVRGRKALFRLAGLPSGGFSLRPGSFAGERTIDGAVGDLVVEAVEERLAYDEVMASLPSPESKPLLQVVQDLFSTEFTAVERLVLARAQKAESLSDLIDAVPETDLEAARAVQHLQGLGLLALEEPAGRVHVFTDSTADLLKTVARRNGINMLSASILVGSEVYRDGVDLKPEGFFKKLKDTSAMPDTNPATQGEFASEYKRVVASGDILGIYCSSKLSECHANAAKAAAESMSDLVELRREAGVSAAPSVFAIDSGQCSASLGMMVLIATRLLRKGLSIEDVAAMLESMKPRFRSCLALKSLQYFARTHALKIASAGTQDTSIPGRFILALEDGDARLIGRMPPGPRTRSRLVDLAAIGLDLQRPVMVALAHSSAPAEAAAMRPQLHDRFKIIELREEQIGPAVMCHTGPGTIAVGVFQPTPDELELVRDDS